MTPSPQPELELPRQVFKTDFEDIGHVWGMFGARFFAAIFLDF
jgi:hypothetical protein